MNNNLPPCPLEPVDRDIVVQYLQRDELLAAEAERLRARSFGKRVFRSAQLRHTIAQLKGMQSVSRSLYPDTLSHETIDTYTAWVESLSDELDPLA